MKTELVAMGRNSSRDFRGCNSIDPLLQRFGIQTRCDPRRRLSVSFELGRPAIGYIIRIISDLGANTV